MLYVVCFMPHFGGVFVFWTWSWWCNLTTIHFGVCNILVMSKQASNRRRNAETPHNGDNIHRETNNSNETIWSEELFWQNLPPKLKHIHAESRHITKHSQSMHISQRWHETMSKDWIRNHRRHIPTGSRGTNTWRQNTGDGRYFDIIFYAEQYSNPSS